jgi:hypothetical protein
MTKSVTNAPEVSALPRKGPEPHAAVSHEPQSSTESSRRVLQPIERISEVLFGLIMVLTITCSFSIAEADRKNVRAMLLGALGCNLAWGIIDGFMYLMACFSSRGQNISKLRALRKSRTSGEANQIIGEALPPLVMSVLTQPELDSLRQRLNGLPEPAERLSLRKRTGWGRSLSSCLFPSPRFPWCCRSFLSAMPEWLCASRTESRFQCFSLPVMRSGAMPDIARCAPVFGWF